MHIISGQEQADIVRERHIVLEIDTVRLKQSGEIMQLFAVVETLPFKEIENKLINTEKHGEMVAAYRNKDWECVNHHVRELMGLWNEELDPFYKELKMRAENAVLHGVPDDWTYIIDK